MNRKRQRRTLVAALGAGWMLESIATVRANPVLALPIGGSKPREISLRNFDRSGRDIVAEIVECKGGQVLRRESTAK